MENMGEDASSIITHNKAGVSLRVNTGAKGVKPTWSRTCEQVAAFALQKGRRGMGKSGRAGCPDPLGVLY